MKLKSFFSRLPKWLVLLVILAAFYFIFRKSVEGFVTCYRYYKKDSKGYCGSTQTSETIPNGTTYNNSRCTGNIKFVKYDTDKDNCNNSS
jgi:hypothetical protein